MLLLDNVSGNSTSPWIKGQGHNVTMIVSATSFGNGKVTFEHREATPSATAIPVYEPNTSTIFEIKYNHVFQINVPATMEIRAKFTVTGGGGGASGIRVVALL